MTTVILRARDGSHQFLTFGTRLFGGCIKEFESTKKRVVVLVQDCPISPVTSGAVLMIKERCRRGHAKQRKVKALGLGWRPACNSEAASVKIPYSSSQCHGPCRR